jgi:hypothetical protein
MVDYTLQYGLHPVILGTCRAIYDEAWLVIYGYCISFSCCALGLHDPHYNTVVCALFSYHDLNDGLVDFRTLPQFCQKESWESKMLLWIIFIILRSMPRPYL